MNKGWATESGLVGLEKLDEDKIESKNEYSKRIKWEEIDELRGIQLHVQFGADAENKKSVDSWNWHRHGTLKRETEGLLSIPQ